MCRTVINNQTNQSYYMKTSAENRCIRVFISSTFLDMKQERDFLVSTVFPNLRKKAAERNVTLIDVDLRWGIKESESKEFKVVDICIDEIEKSHPFFIGLLGDRYGWAPIESDGTDWSKVISDKNQWVTALIAQGKSMTEIEIIYGVLNAEDQVQGCFFVKNCNEDKLDPRQKALRDSVKAQSKLPVYDYNNSEDVCTLVEKDFENLLDKLFPIGDKDEFALQKETQENYIRSLTEYYTPVPATDELLKACAKGDGHIILKGKSGMGKSTCMAKLATELMNQGNCDVISYFSGNNLHNTTFEDVIDWVSISLSKLYNIECPDTAITEKLSTLLSRISINRPLYILLDGLNQYQTEVKNIKNFSWWPDWPSGVVCVFSSTDEAPILKELTPLCTHTITVREMLLDQRLQLIDKYMTPYRKQLNEKQYSLLLTDSSLIRNTHLLATMLDEVRRYGSFEGLDNFISDLATSKDSLEFYNKIFDNQEVVFNNADELANVLSLIALSEQGMPETDLLAISGVTRLKLSQILISNQQNLSLRNGRLMISHQIFLDALKQRYIQDEDFITTQREKIISYYAERKDDRTLIATFELCYQYYMLAYDDQLYELLSQLWVFDKFSDYGRIFVYTKYWNTLLLGNPYRYDPRIIVNDSLTSMENHDYNFTLLLRESMIRLWLPHWFEIVKTFMITMEQPKYAADILHLIIKAIHGLHDEDMDEYLRMAYNYLAACESKLENWDAALKVYQELLEHYELENHDAIISNLGETLLSIYEATKKDKFLQMAINVLYSVLQARIETCTPSEQMDVAVAYANLACALNYSDHAESVRMHEKAMEIYRGKIGHNSIDVAIEYNNLALETAKSDVGKAIEYAKEALSIYEEHDEKASQSGHALNVLADLHYKSGDYATAAQEYAEILNNKVYLSLNPDSYFDIQNNLMYCQFRLKDFKEAIATGIDLTNHLKDNDPRKITILGNIGKFYISITDIDNSAEYYEKAISLAAKFRQYEKELDAYIFLSQAYLGANLIDKVVETLDKLFDKAYEYNMHISRYGAYAQFNKGLIIARYYNDIDAGISEIESAIAIREQTDDESKESDLDEYKKALERVLASAEYSAEIASNEGESQPSNDEIDELNRYLSDIRDADVAENLAHHFSIGYQSFNNGNLEAAKNHFEMCIEMINEIEYPAFSVKSQVTRYYAYTLELIHVKSSFEKHSKEEILGYYNFALEFAKADENYSLTRKILHDIAELHWSLGDFYGAESFYWQELAENLSHNIIIDTTNLHACVNIIAAMKNQESEGDPMLRLHTASLGLTFLRQDKDLYESYRNLEDFFGKAMAEALDDLNISQDDYEINYGLSVHLLADYIISSDLISNNRIARCMYNFALAYYKRDGDNKNCALCIHNCALTTYRDALYGMTVSWLWDEMDFLRENLTEDKFNNAVDMLARSYIRIHDIDKLNELCHSYGLNPGIFQDEVSSTTPCLALLMQGNFNEAQDLVEELRARDIDDLEESELYDLTLYYLNTDSPLEANRYFKAWGEIIQYHHDYSYLVLEYNSLSDILENSINFN